MLRLRKILLCNEVYYLFFLVALISTLLRIYLPRSSAYSEKSTHFTGIITNIIEKEDYVRITINNKESILGNYDKTKWQELSLNLGDTITVEGIFTSPEKNTTEYLFNYQKYCYRRNIFYLVKIKKIKVIKKTHHPIYLMKQLIKKRIGINPYLNTFLLGDKSYLSEEVKRSYQENGISHLFAISGMHISLLANILEKTLKRIKPLKDKVFFATTGFFIIYLFLVGMSPSFLRGILFYILFSLNKIYYFYIDSKNLFLGILSISLLISPNSVFDVGFWYSYWISFVLILEGKNLQSSSYWKSLWKVSILSFLVSFPITIFIFYQINFLSIIYNLFFVPFVSIFLFPFTLITFFIKPLEPIYNILTFFLEQTSIFISKISFAKFIWKRVPIYIYGIYLILLLCFLLTKKKQILILLFSFWTIHYMVPYFDSSTYIKAIDVGQGDSTLLHINRKTILIDTGGLYQEGDVFYHTLLPLLKSLGISKIENLILTHGDKDHLGDSITLVKNFKVEKVILNCGGYNTLEQELIKVLNKKKINYKTCINELNINNNKLYFLQTKVYDNENDNSNVIYTEISGYKFMFMGDASMVTEKEILKEYDLPDIDVLKAGHHGSKTSSSKEFIDVITPKYSIISAGRDNKFGHPNKETLDNLESSKIYRTDQVGTITFKIKNNQLVIETCNS